MTGDGIKVRRSIGTQILIDDEAIDCLFRLVRAYSLEEAAVKAGRNKREKMNGRANIARSPVCRVCEWEERARGRRGAGEGCNSRVSRMKKRKNGGGRTR